MDQSPSFANRIDLSQLQEAVNRIRGEIRKIIVGQEQMVDLLITAILADGHVLIEGVPGVAKTLAARLLARVLEIRFSRIQFTPDLMPSDVTGTSVFNLKNSEFQFNRGPVFANLVLIDEINRAPAKTQAALFEVMEERQVTVDGRTYPMDPPFMVVATQNPVEQEGTYRLPEAQLDRFLFKISVRYPDLEEEKLILSEFQDRGSINDISQIQAVLTGAQIGALREVVRKIHIDAPLNHYVAQLAHATRNNGDLYLGASPRASIALVTAARGFAAIQGRDFVTPEDIRDVLPSVWGHRLMLTSEKEMEGGTSESVLREIVQQVEIPR
ncbi:MAG TPA: MoxR family ATPase [Calditrichia bacterium]|nr:MoxR family ATPase [Calditrichota bacterium]HQU72250.1 MoxR family ATPase [Calditrichia bacterium]HQV30983.1 MoxR family ATPase [Calditrichia bacterium]